VPRCWQADVGPRRNRRLSGVKITDEDQQPCLGAGDESTAHGIAHLQLVPSLVTSLNAGHQRQEWMERDVPACSPKPPEPDHHIHHRLTVPSVIPVGATEVSIPKQAPCRSFIRRRHEAIEQWAVSFGHLQTDRDWTSFSGLAHDAQEGSGGLDCAVGLPHDDDLLRLAQQGHRAIG